MAEGTSPSLHVERLVPLLVLVRPPGRTTAANRRSVVHGNRHLHECPVDALRCILFDVCTVCLSLWCIIEPREGLSEPEQVSLWRQHQSTWGCRYARLPHVAPGVEQYEVCPTVLVRGGDSGRGLQALGQHHWCLGFTQALCDFSVRLP